jgi:hypothetical protein
VVEAEADAGYYRIDGVTPDAGLVAVLAGWCAGAGRLIRELRTTGGSLEDVYLELTGGSGAAQVSGPAARTPA